MRVAVIGAGKMGRWFTRLFKGEGYSVVVSSRTQSKAEALGSEFGAEVADNYVDAVKDADWILLCVSLDGLEPVLKEIGSHIQAGQVVMDIGSIKEIPVQLLHKYVENGVTLGAHPVFGPGAKSLREQNFVLTPVDEEEKRFAAEFKDWLEERGTEVTVLSPRRHDELMALVLGFPHFVGLVAGDALSNNSYFVDAKRVGGATYKLLLTLAGAVAAEEPVFYSNLHMSLPEMEQIEELFLSKVEEWLKLVKRKDCEGFGRKMEEVKKRLRELDPDFERYYLLMYRLLGSS
ncbi:MAG TPA: prephenate dehydrogenase/arogenate dehydrogenase family protein [Candidatus Bathyarchaeota archaeon]|nr:prephenate dehydrogenase/arogenate dehydrogenase family protein [Candidatus Bathyarchaeota archaeon]